MLQSILNQLKNFWSKYRILSNILLYLLVFLLSVIFSTQLCAPDSLKESNFLNWDAEHYHWIKTNGYEGFRIAFFPLLPFMWKALSFGTYGIVLMNAALFISAFYYLVKMLKMDTVEVLLYLSIPSGIFYFLPYTESLFFFMSTLILVGYNKNKTGLVIAGLLLSSLARPAFIFFLPAIILTELYNQKITFKSIVRIAVFSLTLVVGLAIVFGIHFYYTGNWFSYFEMTKGWGGILQFPKLPFTSWAGGMILRLDGVALLTGIFSGILLVVIFVKARFLKNIEIPKELVFSLSYLAGITLFILFRGGALFSLNRFVFAVPFIIVAFNFWRKLDIRFNMKQLWLVFGLIFFFWFLFNSFVHIQTILKFLALTCYVILIFAIKSDRMKVRNTSLILFISVNIIFQIIFYLRFLNAGWIG